MVFSNAFSYRDGILTLEGLTPEAAKAVMLYAFSLDRIEASERVAIVTEPKVGAKAAPVVGPPTTIEAVAGSNGVRMNIGGNGAACNPSALTTPTPPVVVTSAAPAAGPPPPAPPPAYTAPEQPAAAKGRTRLGKAPTAPAAPPEAPAAPPPSTVVEAPAGNPVDPWGLTGNGTDPDAPAPPREAAPANGATAPATSEGSTAGGDLDIALIAGMPKLKDILSHLMKNGVQGKDALIAKCREIRSQVPILSRIPEGDFNERIPRTLEVLAPS